MDKRQRVTIGDIMRSTAWWYPHVAGRQQWRVFIAAVRRGMPEALQVRPRKKGH